MHYTKNLYPSAHWLLLGLLSILTACGGDSKQEEACDQAAEGNFVILNGIQCVFGTSDAGTVKPSDSGTTSFAADSPAFGNEMDEYEPNTSLDNANPVFFSDAALAVKGELALSQDAADNYVFTPNISGDYQIYLCADSCEQALRSTSLNLMVLDQSQTTIAATSLGVDYEKTLTVYLHAGMAYYTEVRTFGAQDRYRLAITRID